MKTSEADVSRTQRTIDRQTAERNNALAMPRIVSNFARNHSSGNSAQFMIIYHFLTNIPNCTRVAICAWHVDYSRLLVVCDGDDNIARAPQWAHTHTHQSLRMPVFIVEKVFRLIWLICLKTKHMISTTSSLFIHSAFTRHAWKVWIVNKWAFLLINNHN